ncbi:MAG: VCBS repeat-containing protein [Verrucomicrobia bacterium]|nr:VCBS repeat-containing protein [Verrucomicrobiota bacterium]
MIFRYIKTQLIPVILWVVISLVPFGLNLSSAGSATEPWGFGALEMFPIDPQIQLASAADVNNDGLTDLIVANPRKSEITLLLNQTGVNISDPDVSLSENLNLNETVNELPPDARFKRDSVLLQSRLKILSLDDLDGDSLPEIIFYDDRDHLKILWNAEEGAWSEKVEWLLPGGLSGLTSLVIADLNMDSRPDVALLGEGWLTILNNQGARNFDRPQKIQIPSGVASLEVLDLNHDKRLDLVLHLPNHKNGLFVSFRNERSFGAFMQVSSPPMSKVHWLPEDARGEVLMVAISDHLEQILVYAWGSMAQVDDYESEVAGALRIIQFPDFSGIKRGVCWADLNDDQQDDCLVSDPDAGLINVYLSNAEGGWDLPLVFPSLTGVEELHVLDWGHTGDLEIFILSKDENQVGHAKWDQKRQTLTYPEKLLGLTKPLVMAAQPALSGTVPQTLVVLHEVEQGWAVSSIESDLEMKTQTFEGRLNGIPERLMAHDLDQDSLVDCILFTPYEPLICLRQTDDQSYELITLSPPGGSWQGGWATAGDLDFDGFLDLIMPFKNMARGFKMKSDLASNVSDNAKDREWSLKVIEQINGPSNTSHLASAVVGENVFQNDPGVVLFDRTGTRLHIAHRDSMGVWRVRKSQGIPVSDVIGLQWLMGGNKGVPMLLCHGKSEAVVKTFGGKVTQLKQLDAQNSQAKEARLHSLIPVDLNDDGFIEVFSLETTEHSIECFQLESDRSLIKLNQWSVFEKRSYRNQGAAFPEPKEGIVADFTGDGLLDLCLIVHDRVILYPQRAWAGTESDN